MKVNVPGRGTVDIRGVATAGPVWTDPDMYWEVRRYLQRTADAGRDADSIEFDGIEFRSPPWRGRVNAGMPRQMVRDLADEFPDGTPRYDGACLPPRMEHRRADDLRRGRGEHARRRGHGHRRVGARPRTGRRGARRGGERAVRTIEYECGCCGRRTATEPLRYARTVLRDSVRVDGSMHELCPACIRSPHGWFAAGEKQKGGE